MPFLMLFALRTTFSHCESDVPSGTAPLESRAAVSRVGCIGCAATQAAARV